MEFMQLLGMFSLSYIIIRLNMEEREVEVDPKEKRKRGRKDDSEPETRWEIVNWK